LNKPFPAETNFKLACIKKNAKGHKKEITPRTQVSMRMFWKRSTYFKDHTLLEPGNIVKLLSFTHENAMKR
jgi:hypothetical protein